MTHRSSTADHHDKAGEPAAEPADRAESTDRAESPGRAAPTGADRARQVVVAVSAVVAVVGAFFGSGAFGGQAMPEAAGGAFAADATPVAPGGPAFGIWSVIYLGLLAYAVWQWLPRQAASPRHRRIGYWVAASMLLNTAWLLAVQAALLWLTLVIMAALLVVLLVVFVALRRTPGSGIVDAIITDGTMGVYLGWIIVATIANVAAVLAAEGFTVDEPDFWAVAVLGVGGLIGVALAIWGAGRIAPALAICWGLCWVGVARLTGELLSQPAAVAAFVAAGVVALATVIMRVRAVTRMRTERSRSR